MTGEWVDAVWKNVCQDFKEGTSATDDIFLSYTCPVFKGLVICVSQLNKKDKEILKKLIEDNGKLKIEIYLSLNCIYMWRPHY